MARAKKCDKWLPADPLRIRAFACSLMPNGLDGRHLQKPNATDIQKTLERCALDEPLSDSAINKWLAAESRPLPRNIQVIGATFPHSTAWLEPNIELTPISRFLCALDVWGSPIDSPSRTLSQASNVTTVGYGLSALEKRWGALPITDGQEAILGFAIPKLKRRLPKDVPDTIFQFHNPLSLMEFMFRCGPYLEMTAKEFQEWAVDLGSLTLFVSAFFESLSGEHRSQSGIAGDYSSFLYNVLFRAHDNWPSAELVKERLEIFPEFDSSAQERYSQLLIDANKAIGYELQSIGSDLAIVETLLFQARNSGEVRQQLDDRKVKLFDESQLVQPKCNIRPIAHRRYKYEFLKKTNGEKIVICHDLENGTRAKLPKRSDLFGEYKGHFEWGYKGEGPRCLTFSLLAHHLGHSDFGDEEVRRLLDMFISRLPNRSMETSFFLTTQLIDRYLNE